MRWLVDKTPLEFVPGLGISQDQRIVKSVGVENGVTDIPGVKIIGCIAEILRVGRIAQRQPKFTPQLRCLQISRAQIGNLLPDPDQVGVGDVVNSGESVDGLAGQLADFGQRVVRLNSVDGGLNLKAEKHHYQSHEIFLHDFSPFLSVGKIVNRKEDSLRSADRCRL